jgi:hypothetical protein
MARITMDVDDEWLHAARAVLGTDRTVTTINAALRSIALSRQAAHAMAALDSVDVDVAGSGRGWRYGGGRDLDRLVADARAYRTGAPAAQR